MASALPSPSEPSPDDPLDSPEVLMINALMEAPEGFVPEAYGVHKDMLASHEKIWQFCYDHQKSEGHPPSRELFVKQYPSFELVRGVKPRWAADKLRAAHKERTIRKEVRDALHLLNEGSVDDAQEALRAIVRPQPHDEISGLNVLDPSTVAEEDVKVAFGTPWAYLTRLLRGGVGLGEQILIAARFGHGKSWILPTLGAAMAENGARCALITMEMPSQSYTKRIHKILTRNDVKLQKRLLSPDRKTREAALGELTEKVHGRFEVFDPSDLSPDPRSVRKLAQNNDYVLIDYLGLMSTSDGTPAVKDYRAIAEISGECKRIALEERAGMVIAVQINREGEGCPKLNHIAGADDLGRDADIIALMHRMAESSMEIEIAKNRGGRPGRIYTTFEPDTARFAEISYDEALARSARDQLTNQT